MWRAWSQRPLPAREMDRFLVAALLVWALFDVPWWWRPPGHGGSALAVLSVLGLAAAQSVPFLWRRSQPAAVLALAGASLAVKYATHLNVWSAGAAVLAAAYGLGAYGNRAMRQATRLLAFGAVLAALVTLQAGEGNHSATVACALLATALALGEVTSAHRDIATVAARHAHELERASLARELHAGATATVHLAYRADGVTVDVVDDGPGPPTPGTAGQGGGTGLAGLSERVRLAGGWLEAGRGPEGGFMVRAFLPDTR